MISIRTLECRVTVATKKKRSTTAASASPAHPTLSFREAPAPSTGQTAAPASGSVYEPPTNASASTEPSPQRVDPQQVADRVYEIIRDELRLSRLRQGG